MGPRITRADDFPIHQTPEPIAVAGTDRNFYDRYFFNGYLADGSVFFAAALGVYPHLNVMDASFCVVVDGVQHNLHASRLLAQERMDTQVGPIAVHVVEPLKRLRIHVEDAERAIAADLVFHARHAPVAEPRFIHRNGPRTVMDVTRMTQNGTWEGTITLKGRTLNFARGSTLGTRDRSWGVRPIGAPDPQPAVPAQLPQFYWLWAPTNFTDRSVYFHVNEYADGAAWNTHARVAMDGADEAAGLDAPRARLSLKPGTRHARAAVITMRDGERAMRLVLDPKWQFYMHGLGYMNAEWGHGLWKGELATGHDEIVLGEADETALDRLHIQAFCTAILEDDSGRGLKGSGVLEQLIIGPHAPSGLRDVLDGAPA